jgi:hypothetical protein
MNKRNLILAAILVVLAASAYFYQGPVGDWLEERGEPDNWLSGIDLAEVGKVVVVNNNGTTTLVRIDDRWKIEGTKDFYVPANVAVNMESALEDAGVAEPEVVSTNPDNKVEFQTDDNNGVTVELYQDNGLAASFIVGKLASDFSSTYVSRSDISETYKIAADLNRAFARAEWYDRAIFSAKEDDVTEIRFQYPESEFTVTREGEGDEATWVGTIPYRFAVDDEKVNKVAAIMANLDAAEIPEQTFEGTGLGSHEIIVQATGKGLDHTLMVGNARDPEAEEPLYYAKKGSSDNIYLITEEQKEILDTSIRELR